MYLQEEEFKALLVGKTVKKIFMNSEFLKFETDKGNVVFTVSGDCCSVSYFHDFYGVKKLFENGKIIDFKELELKEGDDNVTCTKDCCKDGDCISHYGYSITTENKELGEQTSVFSFRNDSNGYYGGSLEIARDREVLPEIIDDVL